MQGHALGPDSAATCRPRPARGSIRPGIGRPTGVRWAARSPATLLGCAVHFFHGRGTGPRRLLNDPFDRVRDCVGAGPGAVSGDRPDPAVLARIAGKRRDQPPHDHRVRHAEQRAPTEGLEPAGSERGQRTQLLRWRRQYRRRRQGRLQLRQPGLGPGQLGDRRERASRSDRRPGQDRLCDQRQAHGYRQAQHLRAGAHGQEQPQRQDHPVL